MTWVVGLSPATIARYWWKCEPLRPRLATVIAATTCIFFAIFFLIVKSSLGAEKRISPASVLVFFVSRAILVHGSKRRVVAKLRTILADPGIQSDRKKWARTQLARLGENADVPKNSIQSVGNDDLGSPRVIHRSDWSSFLSSRIFRLAALALGGLFATNALLLISGQRLLVGEEIVAAGEEVVWQDRIIGHQQLIATHFARKPFDESTGASCEVRCFRPPASTVLDLTAFFDVTDAVKLRAGIFNILDETYAYWSDVRGLSDTSPITEAFTRPGRNASVSLSFRF